MSLASAESLAPRVVAVSIDGMVHPITVEMISRAEDQARRENAALVLVRLNTPGGVLDSTREIIEKIISLCQPDRALLPSGRPSDTQALQPCLTQSGPVKGKDRGFSKEHRRYGTVYAGIAMRLDDGGSGEEV